MKRFLNYIDNLGLRTKLVITYIILITIPIVIVGFRYNAVSTEVVSDIAKKNAYQLIKKNNEILDTKLSRVMDNITAFITDKDLLNTFTELKPDDDYNILLMDNKINSIISKYFIQAQDLYSAQLATSYFVFTPRSLTMTTVKGLIPKEGFVNSRLYTMAKEQAGKIQWVPTYDFAKMFNVEYLNDVNIDYRYLFSAVIEVNGTYYDNGVYASMGSDTEKPILILNFKEDFFQKLFKNSIPVDDSYFFIITQDGQVVSHQDQTKLTQHISDSWLKDISKKASGTDVVEINGKKMIVCYDRSKVTGWISVVVIPPERLLDQIIPVIKSYTLYAAAILIVISIIISYFISFKITNPISKLMKAIKKTGEGNFDLKLSEEGSKESKELIHRFNIMNEKIQKLIEENYEIKIKEKEAEITALNLQLDPHFMYNTLNLINLISVENGQEEISEMLISLSTMLKYTVKTKKDLVPFKEDMDYLKSYILIMTKRFEGKFVVEYDIDPKLNESLVPKFFLQPFVENSLVHGFNSLKKGGVLKINCWMENTFRYFCIQDNGNGMNKERIAEISASETGSVGINNVNKRIKIIYGEDYGVAIESEPAEGTKVIISLPMEEPEGPANR